MKKKYSVLLGIVATSLVVVGCQNSADVENDIQAKVEKNKQSQKEMIKSQDLSSLSGEARSITEQLGQTDKSNNSRQNNQLNNKKDMNDSSQSKGTDKNKLPIDMKLAETCKSVVLKTNMGDIEIEFFGDKAPMTVANFCTLSKKGFYDNLTFHRVIKNFMIQGGDPKGDSTGGPGYKFKDELYPENSNDKYTIAMANAGPNTNGSQFFINTKANHFLDRKHTVFGKVIKGQDVVDKIENTDTGMNDKPVKAVTIFKAIITEK